MDSSLFLELKQTLPCRSAQIEQLYNLFAYKDEPFVDNIYIYGGPSVGKSTVVTTLLKRLQVKYVMVNLIECYTSKIVFEAILYKLCEGRNIKCDNMMDFVDYLQTNSGEINFNGAVIVFDKAERLRNMDFNLLAGFMRIKELTGLAITVIFISEIVIEKYYSKTNILEPIKIYFPQYNKEELLEILSTDFDYARSLVIKSSNEMFTFDLDFYRKYLNVFLSVFYRACRDLAELRHISRNNFINYCQPIINKECTTTDSVVLWRRFAPILKSSLQVLYLRVSMELNEFEQKPSNEVLSHNLELPFYAKFLLIAAYLASYNSAKDDKRLFMKYHGKKRKTMKDVKKRSKINEQLNTQLGPKPFSLDRLLAIFYSILEDKVGFNNNLLVQVSSLVELQLLTALTDNCVLDGQKYKCNVNFEFIQNISKMVGFNIRKYLSDFSHM